MFTYGKGRKSNLGGHRLNVGHQTKKKTHNSIGASIFMALGVLFLFFNGKYVNSIRQPIQMLCSTLISFFFPVT